MFLIVRNRKKFQQKMSHEDRGKFKRIRLDKVRKMTIFERRNLQCFDKIFELLYSSGGWEDVCGIAGMSDCLTLKQREALSTSHPH
jgi:hypothetical protein